MVHRPNRRCFVLGQGYEDVGTKIKKHADEEQVIAVTDWAGDLEREHKCRVRIVLYPTGAKGRLSARIEACDVAGEQLVGVRVRRATSYPNSFGTSLLGVILKELIALGLDLEAYEHLCAGGNSGNGAESVNTP